MGLKLGFLSALLALPANGLAAVGIHVSPSNPEIGDTVTLTITGIADPSSVEWNFGESGCGSYNATYNCTPFPGISDCLQTTFQYSSGGQKTVNLTVNGGSFPTSTVVSVQSSGTCPGGGGGCSYAVSPTSRTFDHQAGSGTFTVNTGAECAWTPQTSASWISILSGGGPGSGTVSYQVDQNTGPFRQSTILVSGKTHSVRQDAAPGYHIVASLVLERRNQSGLWIDLEGEDVFPGDQVRVSSNSSGDDITSTEIWITDSDGTIVALSNGSSSAPPLIYTIPLETPDSSYTARVRVQNSVGSDQTNASVPLDRRPQATIEHTPIAPLTGEDLSLTGSGQGTPQLPVGSELPDPFEWLITPPSGEPYALVGETPDDVTLDTPGSWTFGLTVHYAHDNPSGGGPYDATKQVQLDISSVSAALSVSPVTPVNTGNVTLDARASRMAGTVTSPTWTYEFRASGSGTWGPLALCSNSDLCTIPGDDDAPFFSPGQYDFRVTLSDPQTQENSTSEVLGVTIEAPACSYSLTPTSRTIPSTGGSNYTVTVNTNAGCNWTANRSDSWINIQAGSAGSGPGTVTYEITPNTAISERIGAIIVQGQYHAITQNAASVPTDFTPSLENPIEIGQEISFRVSDDRLIPVLWEFGGSNCEGEGQILDCTYTPDFCRSVNWSYEDPGWKTVRLVTTTGEKQIGVLVSTDGACPGAGAPEPCSEGMDDGMPESFVGWGNGDAFVQRVSPDNALGALRRVCFEVTRNGIEEDLTATVVVYDDDGPNGGPGTVIDSGPIDVEGVAVWPDTTQAWFTWGADAVHVIDGAVFVGIEWDDHLYRPFHVPVDQSIGTPQQVMYFRSSPSDPWSEVTAIDPHARALLIRGDFDSLTDRDWSNVVGRVNAEGSFGAWYSGSVTAVFDDPNGQLCAAAESGVSGLEIHCQASDGSWAMQSHAGLSPGQTNDRILTSRWFDDCLYLGTGDDQSFSTAGAEIWRWCDGADPVRVVDDGFGLSGPYAKNGAVLDLEVFGGAVIASTRGADAGAVLGVEAYSSTIGDSWQLIWNRSLGDDADLALPSMTVSDGSLYLGVEANPCRVHRTPDAIAWFGDSMDCFGTAGAGIPRLESWNGAVFAALEGTNQLFFRAAAMDWRPIAAPADLLAVDLIATIDGELYLAGGTADGAVIWQRSGTSWIATNTPGFGDPNNTGIATLDFTSHGIAAGTRNTATGGEVWLTPLPFFADGFESGDVSAWSN
jgi:hypothetical protein